MSTQMWANIGSGNSLLSVGTKPSPKPMLTYHQLGSVALNQFVKWVWKFCLSKLFPHYTVYVCIQYWPTWSAMLLWNSQRIIIITNEYLTCHYSDIIMGAMVSQITSLTIVYSVVYSDPDQRKHQSSASLTFVRGIPRTKTSNVWKCFHLMTSSWILISRHPVFTSNM